MEHSRLRFFQPAHQQQISYRLQAPQHLLLHQIVSLLLRKLGCQVRCHLKKYLSLSVRAAMQVRVQSGLKVCHILDWSVTIYCLPV